jgi:hypothetical protein
MRTHLLGPVVEKRLAIRIGAEGDVEVRFVADIQFVDEGLLRERPVKTSAPPYRQVGAGHHVPTQRCS